MRQLMQWGEAADFTWRRLQYVFRLPGPRELNPTPPVFGDDERALLTRFVDHARTLAGTTLLASDDRVVVSLADPDQKEDVATQLSAPDITVGFMVLLRQC